MWNRFVRGHSFANAGACSCASVCLLPMASSVVLTPWAVAVALLALALSAAAALYAYTTRHFSFWRRKSVPFLRPLPFVGNLKDLLLQRMNIGELLQGVYSESCGHPYMGIFFFDKPVLFIRDHSLWKSILIRDFEYFPDRAFTTSPTDTLFSETLFVRKGDNWKHLRMRLASAYSPGKVKRFFALMEPKAITLGKYFDGAVKNGTPQDVMIGCGRYAMDASSTVGFGFESRALVDDNDPVYKILNSVFKYSKILTAAMVASFVNHPLARLLLTPLVPLSLTRYLRDAIWEEVRQRDSAGRQGARGDFLDHLMELRANGHLKGHDDTLSEGLEGDAFISQAFTFLSGFDASMPTMSLALYHMAKDQPIQERLRRKLQEAMDEHGGKLSYEAVQSVEYLDMIISETLRMYPIFPFLDRLCTKEYRIPGTDLILEKGQVVITSIMGFHRDPELFPYPERFDPERFSKENKNNIPSGAYFPFGEGPRKCIGLRLASLQVKLGLAHVITNYRVHTCTATPEVIKYIPYTFFIHPRDGVPLKFSRV